MKTFSVAVVVAVLLAFMYLQESSALPPSEVEDLEVAVTDDNVDAAYEGMPEDSFKMASSSRRRRRRCRFCCGCCPGMEWNECGTCCKF